VSKNPGNFVPVKDGSHGHSPARSQTVFCESAASADFHSPGPASGSRAVPEISGKKYSKSGVKGACPPGLPPLPGRARVTLTNPLITIPGILQSRNSGSPLQTGTTEILNTDDPPYISWMNLKYSWLVYSIAIILLLAVAGCSVPREGQQTEGTTAVTHTPIPADMTCAIWSKTAAYSYNGFGFSFNQKNPPMFINYTVIPKNVTVNRVYTENGKTVTLTESEYSTSSWFEVTVIDNTTGAIVLQDGFGAGKGYPIYTSRTLKVLKGGNLVVQLKGNDITAGATVWIKPHGNYDESQIPEFTSCMNWEGSRDTMPVAPTTTVSGVIYTWTPENQITG